MHLHGWLTPVYAAIQWMFLSCWTPEMKTLWSFETLELLVQYHIVIFYGLESSAPLLWKSKISCVNFDFFFFGAPQVSVPFGQHLVSSHALHHPHHEPRNIHSLPVPAHSPVHQQGQAEQAPSQGNSRSAGSKSASFSTIALHAVWQMCLTVARRQYLFLKAVVWNWYVHRVQPVDRNIVGKVIEVEDGVLWKHVTYGQG